jgi:hypothetical protein
MPRAEVVKEKITDISDPLPPRGKVLKKTIIDTSKFQKTYLEHLRWSKGSCDRTP